MILLILWSLLFLGGCASMNLESCKNANWETYGQNDLNDSHENRYDFWLEACKSFGVVPNKTEYNNGFDKALVALCTYQNGYLIGSAGQELPRVCPVDAQEKFVKGYIEGKRIHTDEQSRLEQKKITEERNQRELTFRERIIGTYQNRKCQSDMDCRIEDRCSLNKCEKTGKLCNTNRSCEIKGVCNNHRCQF